MASTLSQMTNRVDKGGLRRAVERLEVFFGSSDQNSDQPKEKSPSEEGLNSLTIRFYSWCPRPDLNRHGSPHYPLKIACLPGSTTWAKRSIHQRPGYWDLAGASGFVSGAAGAGSLPGAGGVSGALVSIAAGVSVTIELDWRWLVM
jgi:hypothetical protein